MRPPLRYVVLLVVFAVVAAGCGARFPRELDASGTGDRTSSEVAGETPTDEGEPAPGDAGGTGSAVGAGSAGGAGAAAGGARVPGAAGAGASGAAAGPVEPGPAPGVTANSIKIGYLLPLSGAAPVPSNFDKGARVYWNYVRDKLGGLPIAGAKRNIQIVIEDTQSDANIGKDKAKKLIEQDKVFLIVVLDRLENQQAIGAYLDGRKFPNIEVQTPANLDKSQTWTFGVTIDHAFQGAMIADYAVKTMKAQKVAVVHENTPVLSPGVKAFSGQIEKLGANVVYTKAIDGQNNDFSNEALALAQSGATFTWLYMAPTPAAKLANQADAAGFHPTWFANAISWNFDLIFPVGPKALAGARAFSPWPPLSDPRTGTYKAEYSRQNPSEVPDDLGIVGWGIGEIIGGGLQAVKGQLGQNSFRDAMQNLQLKPTLWNPLSFGPGVREGGNAIAIYRESGGRWVLERDFTGAI